MLWQAMEGGGSRGIARVFRDYSSREGEKKETKMW